MGIRYVVFRVFYVFQTKSGWLKRKFTTNPKFKTFISLEEWKKNTPVFFFKNREDIELKKCKSQKLENHFRDINNGIYTFFGKTKFNLGHSYDWMTNPETGYQYDISKHFTAIQDLAKEAGDIKYVWEKSRFSFLYDIIRYDYHFNQDNSALVFKEIEDFIIKNPINQGPNYKCSQEISLRILNWTFALYFYKSSKSLTESRFSDIINSIYWQLHHVRHNIQFSRIAVRNNHAITETLMLYVSHFLFPFIKETKDWSKKGKKWFEEEIAYQVYEDGTFLQYSMNYHRVVIQLLTWGIRLSELNRQQLHDVVYKKAIGSLDFLDQCVNCDNGWLPNYGSNDGALFFKLSEDDFRDYKSQLDDLRAVVKGEIAYNTNSFGWYGIKQIQFKSVVKKDLSTYSDGGYYLFHDGNTKTLIRCGAYKDRPAQADNLHIDIWVNGENYIWDTGSYKYNTTDKNIDFFMGTKGHNTITLNGENQMLKGGRFIWFYWVKKATATLIKQNNKFLFNGQIQAYKNMSNNIVHQRQVTKKKDVLVWEVEDVISNKDVKDELIQHWHINPKFLEKIEFTVIDDCGVELKPMVDKAYVSNYYGIKELSYHFQYKTRTSKLFTRIDIQA